MAYRPPDTLQPIFIPPNRVGHTSPHFRRYPPSPQGLTSFYFILRLKMRGHPSSLPRILHRVYVGMRSYLVKFVRQFTLKHLYLPAFRVWRTACYRDWETVPNMLHKTTSLLLLGRRPSCLGYRPATLRCFDTARTKSMYHAYYSVRIYDNSVHFDEQQKRTNRSNTSGGIGHWGEICESCKPLVRRDI